MHFTSPSNGNILAENVISGGVAFGSHQQTSSINNHVRHVVKMRENRAGRNTGGPFLTRRVSLSSPTFPHFHAISRYGNGHVRDAYEGVVIPSISTQRLMKAIWDGSVMSNAVWMEPNAMGRTDLRVIGEKIMLSVVPTSSPANAVVSIGELFTEGKLFSAPGKAFLDQNPGGEFLNTQFGILPVVSDAKSFKEAASSYNEIITQYKRDAGKRIRRRTPRYVLEDTETQTGPTSSWPVTPWGQVFPTSLCRIPRLTVTTKTLREVWYSGQFEYHIPKNLSRLEELWFEFNRAYGLVPDPADIWNLLPFSWLADWATNSNAALRHLFLQASEGATQRYGFVMLHSKVQKTYKWTGELRTDGGWQPVSFTFVLNDEVKQRERVIPFGTTYTGLELDARKLAILGALGIAK